MTRRAPPYPNRGTPGAPMSKLHLDPNSAAVREIQLQQQQQAMVARLIVEIASSIYVRRCSDYAGGVKSEEAIEIARQAFDAAKMFVGVATEAPPEPAPAAEPTALVTP